jgi:hypothetical protein
MASHASPKAISRRALSLRMVPSSSRTNLVAAPRPLQRCSSVDRRRECEF